MEAPPGAAATAMTRAARPSAPPICLAVFISPEAAPASAAATPEVTVAVSGVFSRPPPSDISTAGPRTAVR
ncbi:hypothetical protein [Nonomuraea sp. B5E05]|uniref:hypothetical protein n=1 Tax=Nonomuraea sp. B5E05 TaxID=3153569 RepID=UPI00326139E2